MPLWGQVSKCLSGHKLLNIFSPSIPKILSTRDPASLVNIAAADTKARSQNSLASTLKKPASYEAGFLSVPLCPQQESNLHQELRSLLFYPLNYGDDVR